MRKDVLFAEITVNIRGTYGVHKRINKKKSIRFGYSFYLSAQFGHIFRQILLFRNFV